MRRRFALTRCNRVRVRSMLGDAAAPGPGFTTARFDHLLELLEVATGFHAHRTEGVADGFQWTFRLVIHLQRDAGHVVRDLVEGHHAAVRHAGDAAPGDALVRDLFGDLGIPLLVLAGHAGLPVQVAIVEL